MLSAVRTVCAEAVVAVEKVDTRAKTRVERDASRVNFMKGAVFRGEVLLVTLDDK